MDDQMACKESSIYNMYEGISNTGATTTHAHDGTHARAPLVIHPNSRFKIKMKIYL